MTTHGGQNYHPSGKRGLTLREYAALQGFPSGHEFRGSHIKRQIGNAVPPSVAKVLFESIKRDLERADGIVEGPEVIE
jgi:DNA (cytosine-5)-methyltransferase 1